MGKYRQLLTKKQAELDLLTEQKAKCDELKSRLRSQIQELTEARDVVNTVQLATQVTISEFIEELVTLALKSVFGDEYGFKVQYEIKRNKSEATLYIEKNGELFEPEDACGGGVTQVAGFGLRVALFALADPKPQSVLILDEPEKCISSGECIQAFGQMLKKISELLEVQVIMVSHDPVLIESADKAFHVTQVDGVSKVEVL